MRILGTLSQFLVVRLRGLWYGLSLPIALLASARYGYLPGDTLADRISASNFLLSLFGLCAVALGYLELREHFGRPSSWESIKTYFREFYSALRRPRGNKSIITGSGKVRVTGHLAGVLTTSDRSVEKRLEILEEGQKRQEKALESVRNDLNTKHAELSAQLAAEQAAREAGEKASRSLIEGATVGGLGSELVGWIWLLFATLLAGMPGFWIRLIS